MSNWRSWGSCTPTNGKCGSGTRMRSRSIVRQPVCSGSCDKTNESGTCMSNCCPVNCIYNQWNSWSICSNQCGRGITLQICLLLFLLFKERFF